MVNERFIGPFIESKLSEGLALWISTKDIADSISKYKIDDFKKGQPINKKSW